MNSLSAVNRRITGCLLDFLAEFLKEHLPGVRMFGLRAIGSRSGARNLKVDAEIFAAARTSVAGSTTDATSIYGRFQRDIVPHLDAAYNFARCLSRDADAAHDIVQEAFLRAYRGFDG